MAIKELIIKIIICLPKGLREEMIEDTDLIINKL